MLPNDRDHSGPNERISNARAWASVVILLALFMRIGAACWWENRLPEGQRFGWGDSHSYWVLAGQIAQGEPYRFGHGDARIFRTPGYPILLAGLFRFCGGEPPVFVARLLGVVLGALAVAGVMCLTRQLFSTRAAIVAGVLAAIYPGAIGMSVFVLSEAPFCPLMVAQLALWVAAARVDCNKRMASLAFVAGVIAGVATLVRPSWLLFSPFTVLIGLLVYSDRKRQLLLGTVMGLGMIAAMIPWWVRNYGITGKLTLTTTQFGASLYDGWRPDSRGESDMRFVEDFYQEQLQEDAAQPDALVGTFEQRLDDRMKRAAISFAKQNPGRILSLAGIKFVRIWTPWPNADQMQSWTFRLAILCGYTPLMILAIGGTIQFGKRGWPYVLCVMPAVYFTCLHMIFVGSIRYRQPAMLALIVLAAGFVDQYMNRKRN